MVDGEALEATPGPRATDRVLAAGKGDDLVFEPGWDRQDRGLRFVDSILERTYREAMTGPTRRRFRSVLAVGCGLWAIQPVLSVLLLGESPGPAFVVATVVAMASCVAVMLAVDRVGLRWIWMLSWAIFAISELGVAAAGIEAGSSLDYTALAIAAVGIYIIAWVRVAWWVAAAICVCGLALFLGVALATEGGGVAIWQAVFMVAALGGATFGSWFLESAERRSFAQGLLVDHQRGLIDRLFRSYLSPDVAQALVEDPARAELGGEVVEVSVLFADLRGYTPFSEGRSPAEVVAMLNTVFGAAVPAVFSEGGTIVQFMGDALMAIFNAPLRQSDHALRACRAGLALQAAVRTTPISGVAPCFRVGINTGPALVGNIGSAELRNFSALGDTTNTAARLQTYAPEGSVIIGERTYELVRDSVEVRTLGEVELKGKAAPTMVFELIGVGEGELIDP